MPRQTVPLKRTAMKRGPSVKRAGLTVARSDTRRVVIERDGGVCAGWNIPGVPHSHRYAAVPEGMQEVHELQGGIMRADRFCDPDWCVLTCSETNQWISNGSPREAERRGLRVPSWAGERERDEARELRALWRRGMEPVPSWWPESESDRARMAPLAESE